MDSVIKIHTAIELFLFFQNVFIKLYSLWKVTLQSNEIYTHIENINLLIKYYI